MQFKDFILVIIAIVVVHILVQAYYIKHCYNNLNLSKQTKAIYIIAIIILNLPAAALYLFKNKEDLQITMDNYKRVEIDDNTIHGIFIFLVIAFEVFGLRIISENNKNPYQLLLIILLFHSFIIFLIHNMFLKNERQNILHHLFPIIQLILIIPIEYIDNSYNAHFIMVIVTSSIINKFTFNLAKTYSIIAFCTFLIGSTAKTMKYYSVLGIQGTVSYLYISIMVFLLLIFAFYSFKKYLLINKRLHFAEIIVRDQSIQLEEIGAIAERSRITAEIHDTVGHRLMGAIVTIEAVEKALINNHEITNKLLKARDQIKQGLNDIRSSVRAIRAETDMSFEMLIDTLKKDIKENTGFTINYVLNIKSELLSLQQHIILQYIKECATNSIKHGKCSEADVLIQEHKGNIYLSYSDNGVGSDNIKFGFGLNNMRERVESIGGKLDTESIKGEGFTVSISIPIGRYHGGVE